MEGGGRQGEREREAKILQYICSAPQYGRSSVDLIYRSVSTTGRDSQENSQWHRQVRSGQEGGSVPPESRDLIQSGLGSRIYIAHFQYYFKAKLYFAYLQIYTILHKS